MVKQCIILSGTQRRSCADAVVFEVGSVIQTINQVNILSIKIYNMSIKQISIIDK